MMKRKSAKLDRICILIVFVLLLSSLCRSREAISAPQMNQKVEKVKIFPADESGSHYFQYKNKPVLLIGDSVTQGWMESGKDFDYKGYIDAISSKGINLVMIWSYIGTSSKTQINDPRIGYNSPELWPWKGSPDNRSFDLSKFNEEYFKRLKLFVSYAAKHDVIFLITVHNGGVKWRFRNHPFNRNLGNGPLKYGKQYVDLYDYDKEISDPFDRNWNYRKKNQFFQERFCAKLIEELNEYPNVIYELFNEGRWYDKKLRRKHEQHFLSFFRKRCKNLLLTNTDFIVNDAPYNDNKVDVITIHGEWLKTEDELQKMYHTRPAKPVLISEPVPGFSGDSKFLNTLSRSAWQAALSGIHWVAQNDTSFGWNKKAKMYENTIIRDQAYKYIGNCARFLNNDKLNLAMMGPKNDQASNGICFTETGKTFVTYCQNGEPIKLRTSSLPSRVKYFWFNPESGKNEKAHILQINNTMVFTPPNLHDLILFVELIK